MAENDDEWATVSTVEDDVVDYSNNNSGPSGIDDPSVLKKSRVYSLLLHLLYSMPTVCSFLLFFLMTQCFIF